MILAGYYEGVVVDTKAPATEQAGAVKVRIPEIHGNMTEVPDSSLPWAVPNLMFAGPQCGLVGVPPVNSLVNVIFKHGDKRFPMWIGGSYRSVEVPAAYTAGKQGLEPKTWLWLTPGGYGVVMDELNKTLKLTTPLPSLSGIVIDLTTKKVDVISNSGGATAYTLTLDETQQKAALTTPAGQKVELAEITGTATLQGTTKAVITAALVELGLGASMSILVAELFAAIYDAHTHNVTAIGAPTGVPIPLLTPILNTVTSTTVKLRI